jgi:hypothetical protein
MSPIVWPRRILPAAALAIAAILLALLSLHVASSALRDAAKPATSTLLDPRRVCVTRAGLCPTGTVRAGDPCTCPNPVQGNVPGHVETIDGPPAIAKSRDWPGGGAEDLLYGP